MITYTERTVSKVGTVVDVKLDGKKVGTIHRVVGGWQYQAGKALGEVLPTLQAVKRSLES
jgi:hypothetical protein